MIDAISFRIRIGYQNANGLKFVTGHLNHNTTTPLFSNPHFTQSFIILCSMSLITTTEMYHATIIDITAKDII